MIPLSEIIQGASATSCVACGKCSAACSMSSMYPDFSSAYSPRGMVQLTLQKALGQGEGVREAYLWRCLQCANCTAACPEQVDCAGLIAKLRVNAGNAPERSACKGCGREIPALPVRQWLQNTLEPDASAACQEDGDDYRNTAYLHLCPVCRRQVYAANNAAG